jgi:lipid II:glycine glycyltransferase (peptidoglycan interpeptide bridge formation enzyme)
MMNRDEYVAKLKSQLDQWNTEAAKWEAKTKDAQAGMKAEYARQLEQYQKRRDEALAELRKVQSASADAWSEMMQGADAAFKSMREAFERARSKLDRK